MRQRLRLFMKICEPYASARRVQRRAQRGERGPAGENKKSRLAVWRARANFLFAPAIWSGRRGSNPQPSAWEADAIPLGHSRIYSIVNVFIKVVKLLFE